MSEWQRSTLGDLCVFRGGSAFPRDEQGAESGDLPFVKVGDLAQQTSRYLTRSENWVTIEQALRLRPSVAPPNSVLFAKIGEGIRAERFRVASQETAFDNNLMSATPRAGICHPGFLYYLLLGLNISQFAVGSALPYLRQATLVGVPCLVPDLPQQQAVARVLGALDDKIAANAQVISGADRLSRVTFESILGDEAVPLSSVARFINGKAFTKDATGTGRVVIRIAELNSGLGGSTVYNDLDVPDEHVARPGDLLFAWSGSLTVHRWFRPEAIVNQHIFKVIPTSGYPLWCVNGLLRRKLEDFRDIAANKATTMGHIQRRHLDELVAVPTRAQIERNDAVMTGLWQRALAAEVESLQLEQMRDTLLPQLMSGKIRVKDAEHVVREAV